MLYACEVGQDRDLIAQLSEQPGARVAAATGEGSDSLRDAYRRFVLGDSNNRYYLGNEMSDYALFNDFDATDAIQTRIGSTLFIGGALPAGILGTALYLDNDLVAVVQGTIPTAASFVAV